MSQNFKKFILLFSIFFFIFFFKFAVAQTCQDHNVWGWAWSENIGWISFSCRDRWSVGQGINYGVDIDPVTGNLSGYAWSEHIGWIRFDPEGPYPNCPSTTCPSGSPSYSARLNLSSKKVTGWARACSVFQTGCSGALKDNSERGGWDGWILMGPIVKGGTDYGVWIDNTLTPAQFKGWAWGSDVVGWISFNHLNCDPNGDGFSDGVGGCPSPGTPISDYKVLTSFAFNQPPFPPSDLSYAMDRCAWGAGVNVAPGLSIFLQWNSSDPDGDELTAYEIEVDDNPNFSVPKFNHLVEHFPLTGKNSYVFNLSQDDNSDWLSSLAWNTTYYWRVRVRDEKGNWSEWSAFDPFNTPPHASPYINFIWTPQKPTVNEDVQFCSDYEDGKCEIEPSGGWTKCFSSAGCNWLWDIPNWQYATGSSATSKNPAGKFTSPGTGKVVTLTVTDSDNLSCSLSRSLDVRRLPIWFPGAP